MKRPLFYRLMDPKGDSCDTSEVAQKAYKKQLMKTVVDELQRIVSTRYLSDIKGPRNILNFGIPNIVSIGSGNSEQKDNLLLNIRQAIFAYEPRIIELSLRFAGTAHWNYCYIDMQGKVRLDKQVEYFSFRKKIEL